MMKKSKLFFTMFVMLNISLQTFAQNVGISSVVIVPDPSSMMEVRATNKGILIPQVALTGINDAVTITSPATSLLVYCTGTGGLSPAGYYYNSGTPVLPNWIRFLTNNNGDAWLLLGNAGTSPATNFMGTSDNNDVIFKRNNVRAGLLNSASGNTSWGVSALNPATTGIQNTAIGYQALLNNTIGTSNTAFGWNSLRANTSGNNNTAIGESALISNTSGGANTAIGISSLVLNTTGINNTAVGQSALNANVTGSYNTATGREALMSNTESNNTATGYQSLIFNTSGTNNTAVGVSALSSNTMASNNVAIGNQALYTQSYNAGAAWVSDNVAVGYRALFSNQPTATNNGIHNTAIGNYALQANTIGWDNTATGRDALLTNTSGCTNTANGLQTLRSNTTGSNNTASGVSALYFNISGNFNTANGCNALQANTTGSSNTALGNNAGTTGATHSQCTFIGASSSLSTIRSNVTLLGYGIVDAQCTSDNQVILGNIAVTATKFSGALMPYYGAVYNAGTLGGLLISQGAGVAPQWYAAGAAGQVLTSNGVGVAPTWAAASGGGGWLLIGNAGTIDDISLTGNFLGTTDNKPLSFRVNNLHAGRIETGAGASVYLGSQAGNSSVATGYNTGIGYQALFSNNSSATTNTAVGYKALFANVNGSSNTAVGEGALQNNTSGSNTAIGSEAMMSNTSGGDNTATGLQALQNNTSGNWNTANGFQALQANNGSMNSAIGFMALARNTSGSYNTANGSQALFSNLTGINNTSTGYNASNANIAGNDNAALGYEALQNNTYGGRNTAIGSLALYTQSFLNGSVAWNTENTAIGYKALYTNQPDGGGGGLNGLYNTAVGSQALRGNTIGSSNTAVGYVALPSNTTGQQNVAVGYASLQSNSTGSFNTACGMYACNSTTGSQNTGLGFGTLYNATGQINTAVGMQALYNTSSGNFNTALGANAGSTNTTGSNNTFIGNAADANANAYSNSTAIGNGAIVTASNTVTIGNTSVTQHQFSGALMPYYGAVYNAGTLGQVLTSQGAGLAPQWAAAAAGIDVTAWHITGNTGTTASTSAIGVAVNNNFIGTTDTKDWVMATNSLERMRISSAGNVGINTVTPTATFLLTINPTTNAIRSGIDMTLTGATATAYGLNILTANSNVNGVLVTHQSSSLASSLYAIGGVLDNTNIVSGYCGYRTGSGLSYGLYGINGTIATYATNANTWAAFIRGRAVISSESSPTSLLGTDLEIRNTTTGAAAPVTVSMRQTTQLSVTNNVLANINFGDNYVTTPQAQIQVLRDAAASSAADMPTAMTFSTTADASAALTERMRITNLGRVGIGTTNPSTTLHLKSTAITAAFVETTDNSGFNQAGLTLYGGCAGAAWSIFTNRSDLGGVNDNLTFYKEQGTFGIKMVLTDLGRLGIGTATPSAKLEVQGNVKIVDGTQGLNKVLTSDAVGLASWQVPSAGVDATAWHITGNSGTTASTSAIGVAVNNNFIGTTDAKDWVIATKTFIGFSFSWFSILTNALLTIL